MTAIALIILAGIEIGYCQQLIMLNQLHGQIPRLTVDSVERAFAQHKKCALQCINGFDTGVLSQAEKACVISCHRKYKESERWMAEKIYKIMHEQAMQSQQIAAFYDTNLDKANPDS